MSDAAAPVVNLCTDETPRRPTKRIRPERLEPRVLSLVDSDDDPPSTAQRPRDQAEQAVEHQSRMDVSWGAMEDRQIAPRAVVFRPPSARFRRLPANANPGPIVIEDDDHDANSIRPAMLFRHPPGPAREDHSGVDAASGLVSSLVAPNRTAAVFTVPRLTSTDSSSGIQRLHQQQEQPGDTLEQRVRLRMQQQQQLHHQQQQDQQSVQRPTAVMSCLRPVRRLNRAPLRGDLPGGLALQQRQQQQPLQEQQLPLGGDTEDYEEADMRLAARLQAEEDERLARETAQRMEQDEHRRMMSRLDMLETLESASASLVAADAASRRAVAASERDRAGRRAERLERFAGFGVGGLHRAQDMSSMAALRMGPPRPGRGPGAGSVAMFGVPGAGGAEVAVLDAEVAEAEAAAAAAEIGGGRPRWSNRSLHDMLPAMMALPLGFHRILVGRGDADDGAQLAHRRSRHAAVSAYREHAMAMREQLLAAQRAGIPPHMLLSDRDFTPEDYELLCRLDERVENRKGAKDEQLVALPTEVVGSEGRRRSDGCPATCTICMEEVTPGDVLKRLPCQHDFHSGCVDTWLKTKACCPICQRGLEG